MARVGSVDGRGLLPATGSGPAPQRAAAELLVRLGRREEAERRLAELLGEHPYDGAAAARLVELLLEREAEKDRTLALAFDQRAGFMAFQARLDLVFR